MVEEAAGREKSESFDILIVAQPLPFPGLKSLPWASSRSDTMMGKLCTPRPSSSSTPDAAYPGPANPLFQISFGFQHHAALNTCNTAI